MEVVVELGVPLGRGVSTGFGVLDGCEGGGFGVGLVTHGMSEGVTGSDGGGGRSIRVGAFDMLRVLVCEVEKWPRKGSSVWLSCCSR